MKTAIVYYSMSGNVEQTVGKIAERLEADVIRLEPETAYHDKGFKKFLWGGKSALMGETPALKPYTFNAEEYERIILGTPVWAGTFTPPVRTFIDTHKAALSSKKLSAVVCLSGAGAQKAIDKMKAYLGINAFEAELVLTDPKDKVSEENEKKIDDFCNQLR